MGEEQGRTGEGKGQVERPCVWKDLVYLRKREKANVAAKCVGGD